MLLSGYRLEVSLPDCNHFVTTAHALAELAEDIGAVLPYLNAALEKARYDPNVPALTFQHEERRIVLRPRQVAMASVDNEADARRAMDSLVILINRVWERRADIEPSYRVPKQLKMLDVYRLLPGGNCRACGDATCLAFAGKLAKGEADISACAPLFAPEQESKRERLLRMVDDGEA